MDDIPEFNDEFYETESGSGNLVRLSHLNNKSSVLCPESQDITSQYLVLQQLDAHQRMISRAKSIVDTSAPKSLQSYISVADRQKKKCWRKIPTESRVSNTEEVNDTSRVGTSSRLQTPFPEEDDNLSLNASSMNKGIQAGIPFTTYSSKTADKIAWYLDALTQGELQSQPFICADSSRNASRFSEGPFSANKSRKKVVRGDIMDWHEESFVKSRKPFSPRILTNPNAKSKVKDMRCYNPPFRKKKNSSSHSSDTFESYDHEDESEEEESNVQRSSATSSIEDETQVNKAHSSESYSSFKNSFSTSLLQPNREVYFESLNHSNILSRNEEDKYLNFLSKVTEDILKSGVYSDRAIQQAFEFHMQFYQEETNKDKLQSLLNQVLEGLKISSDDSEDIPNIRKPLLINFSRSNTPPEKESPDIMLTNDDASRTETEFNSREEQNFNLYAINQTVTDVIQSDQSIPQDNIHTLIQDAS